MRTFRLYRHPVSCQLRVVKVGFSWPGFFFGVVWSLFKQLWGVSFVWFFVAIVLVVADRFSTALSTIGSIITFLVFGGLGNTWVESALTQRGFSLLAEMAAETPEGALRKGSSMEQSLNKPEPARPAQPVDIRQDIRKLAIECASGQSVADKLRTLLMSNQSQNLRNVIAEEIIKYANLLPTYKEAWAAVTQETNQKHLRELIEKTWSEGEVVQQLDRLLQTEPEFYDCLVSSPIARQIEPWSRVVAEHRSDYEQRQADLQERERAKQARLKEHQKGLRRRVLRGLAIAGVAIVIMGAFVALRMWKNYVQYRHLDSAKQAINNRNWNKAIEELNAALAIAPSSTPWRDLALAYRHSGKLVEASSALRHCDLGTAVSEDWKLLGDDFVAVTNWQSAMNCYAEATRLLPSSSSAHLALANAYKAQGEIPLAIAMYEKIATNGGMDDYASKSVAEMELGKLYLSRGELESAAHWFDQALPDPEAGLRLGQVYAQQKKWHEAMQVVEKAIELKPMPELWMLLGHVSDQAGNPDKAVTAYEKALALNTNSFDTLRALGSIHQRRGHASEAVAALSRAVQLNTTNAASWAYLACAYADLDDFRSAADSMQKAVECKDETLSTKLAQIYITKKSGDTGQAINLYTKLLAELGQQPQAADVWLDLAGTYLEQEKFDDAVQSITASQKINKSDRADTLLKRVEYGRSLSSAKAAIAGQKFLMANASLVRALKFDPTAKEAQELQEKIRPQVMDAQFKDSAATAEKYFSEGHYLEAMKAGEAALQIQPSGENTHVRELVESARQQYQKESEFTYAMDMAEEFSKNEKWNEALLYVDDALGLRPGNKVANELKRMIQDKRQVWLQSVPILDGNGILARCWDTDRDRTNPDIFHSAYSGRTVTYTGKLAKVLPHPTGEPIISSGDIVLQFKPEGHASKSFFVQAAARGLDQKTVEKSIGGSITITGCLASVTEAPVTIVRFGSKSIIEMTNAWVVKIGR